MESTFSGLLTDYILLILGVVLGLVGMDRGWRYKAWIPLGVFLLNVTVLIVLAAYNRPYNIPEHIAYNRPYALLGYTIQWLGIVIPELLGVVLGIVGMDRGWGYKAWIPLGVFLLIVTVLIVLRAYNTPEMVMAYITVWPILMIVELLGIALGIIGMHRGWGHKVWIPLAVLSVPIDFIFMYLIMYVPG